ncbi:MAG: hypothetical protein NTU58_04060 [Candidatus Nealsonbacteria bacterium]|nr:hypothetical protein [Candidatus Nealsonbacteria bacterium]
MPIFHQGSSSMGRQERSSSKPSMPNKNDRSAVQKIFGRSPPASKAKLKETPVIQSAFGNKSSMSRQEFRSWLRNQPEFKKESYKLYPNLSEDKRVQEIEKNIWGGVGSKWGSLIEKGTKEPERRKFEYERELHTSKIMNDIKQKNRKKFEEGFIDKFIEKKK